MLIPKEFHHEPHELLLRSLSLFVWFVVKKNKNIFIFGQVPRICTPYIDNNIFVVKEC
jgi:hypothetical protein